MTTNFTHKTAYNYTCELCDFNTCKKNDFERHTYTIKHKNNVLTTPNNAKNAKQYKCEICKKEYNDRAGLWRHKKKCSETNTPLTDVPPLDKDIIMMLLKQNSELLEVIKNGTNNTNSHNTNSNNKTFNLQFFLNETCKDAMNIMDFVDSIQLQLSDIERIGQIGYVQGISEIITTNLKALDITKRPVHCTDKKRETIYIKDEDKWEKEDEQRKKLRRAIHRIACKNQNLIPKFKELHPDCTKSSSKYALQYTKIIIECMGGSGDNDAEKEEKIIKNITTASTIDKLLV